MDGHHDKDDDRWVQPKASKGGAIGRGEEQNRSKERSRIPIVKN